MQHSREKTTAHGFVVSAYVSVTSLTVDRTLAFFVCSLTYTFHFEWSIRYVVRQTCCPCDFPLSTMTVHSHSTMMVHSLHLAFSSVKAGDSCLPLNLRMSLLYQQKYPAKQQTSLSGAPRAPPRAAGSMAPPFRSVMALCAPAALAAFVAHPGAMFRTYPLRAETGRSWMRTSSALSHNIRSSHAGKFNSFTSAVRVRDLAISQFVYTSFL